MAINFKLSDVQHVDPQTEGWGRSWFGWDETLSDNELWEQNRGIWVLSEARVRVERYATLSHGGRIQVVAELSGHEIVYDKTKDKDYVALLGDVLHPGDPIRDALVGQADWPDRNPVTYYDTHDLDRLSTSTRATPRATPTNAFLLTNNPERWAPAPGVWERWVDATIKGRSVKENWSVGNRVGGIEPGDPVFLLLQGRGPRGLIGSGHATSRVFEDQHFDADRPGETAPYILVQWEHLLAHEDALPTADLAARFPEQHWDTQMSGITLQPTILAALEAMWAGHLGVSLAATPPPGGGQGWQLDSVKRKVIEDAAQTRLMEHFEGQGWVVRDTRFGNPFDATATRNGEIRYLEAKGTVSAGSSVLVTSGEVDHARRHPGECIMGVLSDVAFLPGGEIDPTAGNFRLLSWDPDAGDLVAQGYSWTPATTTALT
ncbi:DUF3883 domain-containing protein [Dermatophilaceae bacterium Soc4.6]